MNLNKLVKLSNIVALLAIIMLVYWVFIFISIQVFEFKIFRQRMSETFALSVLGLFALMGGSLMINVMFNLTRIAEKHNQDTIIESRKFSKNAIIAFLLSFPLIFGFLFVGNQMTIKKKESMLIDSAKSVIEKYPQKALNLANYRFDENWLLAMNDDLEVFRRTDKNFPEVVVITKDSIDNEDVFLGFKSYSKPTEEKHVTTKKDYIFKTGKSGRDYLNKVFNDNFNEILFIADDGNYELFYPYENNGKRIVFYFTDYQQYGKMGS